jgi:hypothetical protein
MTMETDFIIKSRDPRIDPLKGDVIRKGFASRRVFARYGNEVTYQTDRGTKRRCWISAWQEWARKAEVIRP